MWKSSGYFAPVFPCTLHPHAQVNEYQDRLRAVDGWAYLFTLLGVYRYLAPQSGGPCPGRRDSPSRLHTCTHDISDVVSTYCRVV